MEKDYFVVYFDGMCEPRNPGGNMGIGVFILNPKRERIFTYSKYRSANEMNGQTSNNVAEYLGIIEAFNFILNNNLQDEKIICCRDSKLVINQTRGEWNCNSGIYSEYYYKAKEIKKNFKNISFEWIPREKNSFADNLSKAEALKKRMRI